MSFNKRPVIFYLLYVWLISTSFHGMSIIHHSTFPGSYYNLFHIWCNFLRFVFRRFQKRMFSEQPWKWNSFIHFRTFDIVIIWKWFHLSLAIIIFSVPKDLTTKKITQSSIYNLHAKRFRCLITNATSKTIEKIHLVVLIDQRLKNFEIIGAKVTHNLPQTQACDIFAGLCGFVQSLFERIFVPFHSSGKT